MPKTLDTLKVLWNYHQALRLRFDTREGLLAHQTEKLSRHLVWLAKHSPCYADYKGAAFEELPIIDKKTWVGQFDSINTAGLKFDEVLKTAYEAEATRDFAKKHHGHTVGLSSGTSGSRGVFVVSDAERTQWAGLALARLLPGKLFSGERVAFFLRANSNLYTTVHSRWLTFKFFDLLKPLDQLLLELKEYGATTIVAPAQVLAYLAQRQRDGHLSLPRTRVVSVAEVLEESDKRLLSETLGQPEQVYQATEGFLGYTCSHGSLHLNEEYYVVEPEWLNSARTKFVPVVTDLMRKTQPLVRYRLTDVLTVSRQPCSCGNPSLVIAHIAGRCDDMVLLPSSNTQLVTVFADTLSRLLAQVLPFDVDYRLVQSSLTGMTLTAPVTPASGQAAVDFLLTELTKLGVDTRDLKFHFESAPVVFDPTKKRRRIQRTFT